MKKGSKIRSDYVNNDTIGVLLWALQPVNRLACEVSLCTGWRIDDVLNLKSSQIKHTKVTIIESKTGKRSTKQLGRKLWNELKQICGEVYVFEGRDDYRKHRTRQAVYYDIKRAAKRFNLKINLSPHSLRKNYAVYLRKQGKTLEEIQRELNHQEIVTTMLYVFSDELQQKYRK